MNEAARENGFVLDPRWDEKGLIAGIVTDAASGQLLMVAHLNAEALALTQATGEVHFWSRSRHRIWKKGETSGNVLRVVELRIDCDQDALWIKAEAAGPACHTGARSCFYRVIDGERLRHATDFRIVEYSDALAPVFASLNAAWIEEMFTLEDTDRATLGRPRQEIIERGGVVLFVEDAELGIIGTCALKPASGGAVELTKMAVSPAAQGRKAGEFLLRAAIERADGIGADPLFLLTNRKCAAAVHLYEKSGFAHDAGIMERFGSQYARCDVAMRYSASGPLPFT